MQPSLHPVSPFLLWPRRAESLSGSTGQSNKHSPYSSHHQRRCHRRSKDGRWNGAHPMKVGVGWSIVFPTRLRGSSMVQWSSCGPKELWASPQDHGWGSLPQILHPPQNQQNVSRLEEEFLVDENEEGNCKICVRVWHMSKGQDRSFEASWKSTTFEHSQVEVGKHLHGHHHGFASHLMWVQLNMGHCEPPDQVGSLYTRIHHV
jgi:hypothetical protein